MKEIPWERIASVLITVTLGGALFYLLFQYMLPILLPFLLAYLISFFIRPITKKLSAAFHLPQRITACLLLIVLILGGTYLLWILLLKLIEEAGELIRQLLQSGVLNDAIEEVRRRILPLLERLGFPSLLDSSYLEGMIGDLLYSVLGTLASKLPNFLATLFSSLPSVFLLVVITLVAGFYFCLDGERISDAVNAVLPSRAQQYLQRFKTGLQGLFRRYLRAYLYLFLLTFVLLFIGLIILRVEYAFLLSLLIAFADFLPILGVGTILLPWGLILILQKNYYVGFGLLILYLIISLIRQIMEPRWIGKSLGIHPLLSLFASYTGLLLFGFWGMLLGPIAAILVKGILSSLLSPQKIHAQKEA